MLQPRSIQSTYAIKDKILALDFVLIISILVTNPDLSVKLYFSEYNCAFLREFIDFFLYISTWSSKLWAVRIILIFFFSNKPPQVF